MRSPRAAAAAATVLISLPAAIAIGAAFGGSSGDTVIHFGVGTGFVLLASAAFDFGIPRWAAWIGLLAAGAFGGIFLLQGISDVLQNDALHQVAFNMLGHEIERVLPDIVYVWFAALLVYASTGRTRILGAIVMSTVIGYEIASVAGLALGMPLPTVKILFFAPFVWLLFEALKESRESTKSTAAASRPATGPALS